MRVLALWEVRQVTSPRPAQAATRPAAPPPPPPGASGASWGTPHERARFQAGVARAKYVAEEYVDGKLVQREMRSTPEGVAWLMDGL